MVAEKGCSRRQDEGAGRPLDPQKLALKSSPHTADGNAPTPINGTDPITG